MSRLGTILMVGFCCIFGLALAGCTSGGATTTTATPATTIPTTTTTAAAVTTTTASPTTETSATTTTSVVANTWTELKPGAPLPSATWGSSMAYDPVGKKLVFFGGGGAGGTQAGTWVYDPVANTWADAANPLAKEPSARQEHAMVYDSDRGEMILFGGWQDAGAATKYLSDTWAYEPIANTWTDLEPQGPAPSGCFRAAMVYDPISKRVILFGGQKDLRSPGENTTWAYDPAANTWTELKPKGAVPPGRGRHAMVYDPATKKIILFGGFQFGAAGVSLGDTWAYDPAANTWTDLKPGGSVPRARMGPSMSYDPVTHRAVLFGGDYESGRVGETLKLGDLWAYDPTANTWTDLHPAEPRPSARTGHMMAFDPADRVLILFGGIGEENPNDIWAFHPGD